MTSVAHYSVRLARPLLSVWRLSVLLSCVLTINVVSLNGQCPNTGETKVIRPAQGTGYRFYKFIGDSSFVYFLDGKTFSFNDKDDRGKTIAFIDNFAYESTFVENADLSKYSKSSEPMDILRAQAKQQQDYFKKLVPSMKITDYGPSARKNPDGSDDRLFYLWKKESPPGSEAATQYLVSTPVKDGVIVLSVMLLNASTPEDEVFLQIQKYTSKFDLLSGDRCAKVLSMPIAPSK